MDKKQLETLIISSEKPLILDGAMGSLIQQKGFDTDKDLWTSYLNFRKPEIIVQIHEDYINAGCDIITTNTFRTNPISITNANTQLNIKQAVKRSVELSKEVAVRRSVLLAGSNAPAEDCYCAERTISNSGLVYNHEKHIELLYSSGSDFILNETQSHLDEIKIISEYCSKNNIPYIISLFVTEKLNILSGESLQNVIDIVKEYNPLLITFNCISSQVYTNIIKKTDLSFRWGFYLNCGSGELTDDVIHCGSDENSNAEIVKDSLALSPKLVGACCGSNPNHIRAIKNIL